MLSNTITDAAPILARIYDSLTRAGIDPSHVVIRYRRSTVAVTLEGLAAERASEVWTIFTKAFAAADWGVTADFRDGLDNGRTGTSYHHPLTQARY